MENIENITLASSKKKFRINGDYDKILELEITDMNIITRGREIIPKLEKLQKEASEKLLTINTESEEETLNAYADALTEIDTEMRQYVDELFQSNVSEICADKGSMYDPVNAQFRYENIIETLLALYTDNINSEFTKMENRLKKHTGKYTKKK